MKLRSLRAVQARIRHSRERVVYENNMPTRVKWILFRDILPEVQYDLSAAHDIWCRDCYIPKIYIVDGKYLTRADAYVARGRAGNNRLACDNWWTASGFQSSGQIKAPDLEYRRRRIQEYRRWYAGAGA